MFWILLYIFLVLYIVAAGMLREKKRMKPEFISTVTWFKTSEVKPVFGGTKLATWADEPNFVGIAYYWLPYGEVLGTWEPAVEGSMQGWMDPEYWAEYPEGPK